MRITYCDQCGKRMDKSDSRRLEFRGNNCVFYIERKGLMDDVCYDCTLKALKVMKELKDWTSEDLIKEGI